jgi:hypothetical protein
MARYPGVILLLLASCASPSVDSKPSGGAAPSAHLHDEIGSIVVVDWVQSEEADVHVEFSVDPGIWMTSPTRTRAAGPASELLLGVPYDSDVSYCVVSDDGSGPIASEVATIRTAEIPPELPLPVVTAEDPGAWGIEDRFLVGSVSAGDPLDRAQPNWVFVLDRRARVVWARETPDVRTTLFVRVSADGTKLLWDEGTFWSDLDRGAHSVVQRSSLDLSDVETIATPGLHYAYVDLPDGSLVWGDLSSNPDERLVQGNGTEDPTVLWTCADVRETTGDPKYECASNSLWWDARTNHLLLSLYSSSTVFEIDRATGKMLRWFGNTPGGWGFDPEDTAFEWQHGVSYTDDGNLLMITREEATGTRGALLTSDVPSIAREYALDADQETLVNVWHSDDDIFAQEGGDVHRLPNGNTLLSFGTGAKVREVTTDGTAAWSLDWPANDRLGRTFFVADLYALLP